MTTVAPAFELRGVVHLIRPWGVPARDLDQLLQGIATAPVEVLFRHAVQHQLRHPGAEELPPDDFSAWIGAVVQDAETAERVSFQVQAGNLEPESLRAALVSVLEAIPPRKRVERDAPEGGEFMFLAAASLEFPARIHARDGDELVESLMKADPSVWFLHLIEEPFISGGRASLVEWLLEFGHERLAGWLAEAAKSGLPIDKSRSRLLKRWRQSHVGRRVAEATKLPEDARREVGRQTVARLVRRRTRSGGES